MPLPPSLLAAVNAIEVPRRDAPGTGSIESNFLAFVDVGRSRLGENDVLASTLNRDGASLVYLTPGIENLARNETRPSLIECSSDVEALVSPVVGTGEPREMDLTRANVAVDAVEKTLVPTGAIDVKFIGESIEHVVSYCDDASDTDGDLCRRGLEELDWEWQGESVLIVIVGAIGRSGYHWYTLRWIATADLGV